MGKLTYWGGFNMNGWTNYNTWRIALKIDNIEHEYLHWQNVAKQAKERYPHSTRLQINLIASMLRLSFGESDANWKELASDCVLGGDA